MTSERQNRFLLQLGVHVKVARKLRGLTQEELGRRANYGRQAVINLEKGLPVKTDSLFAVLFVLGLDQQLIDSIALQNDPVGLRLSKLKLSKSTKKKNLIATLEDLNEF